MSIVKKANNKIPNKHMALVKYIENSFLFTLKKLILMLASIDNVTNGIIKL